MSEPRTQAKPRYIHVMLTASCCTYSLKLAVATCACSAALCNLLWINSVNWVYLSLALSAGCSIICGNKRAAPGSRWTVRGGAWDQKPEVLPPAMLCCVQLNDGDKKLQRQWRRKRRDFWIKESAEGKSSLPMSTKHKTGQIRQTVNAVRSVCI